MIMIVTGAINGVLEMVFTETTSTILINMDTITTLGIIAFITTPFSTITSEIIGFTTITIIETIPTPKEALQEQTIEEVTLCIGEAIQITQTEDRLL